MMSSFTRVLRAALVPVTLVAVTVSAPPPTEAAPGDLACTADVTGTFSPPVEPLPGQITIHFDGDLSDCTGTQVGTTGTSGELSANGEGNASCTHLGEAEGQGQIDWSGASPPNSHFDYSITLQLGSVGPLILFDGEVTSGPLEGDNIRMSLIPAADQLTQCLSGGLETLNADGTVSFD